MRIGTYVAVQGPTGIIVMGVEGRQPGYYILFDEVNKQRLYFSHGHFYTEAPPSRLPLAGYGDWIDIPSYLEMHVYTNALTAWAQTKFEERAVS